MKRQIKLIGFLHAEHGSLHSPSWRHRDAAMDFRSPAYFQRIARTLEAGKFHMAFFDDRLAMPGIYGDSVAETARNLRGYLDNLVVG